MAQQAIVTVVTHNPNDQIGGGGCVCGETKRPGCVGPYAVFPAVESSSNISPHIVACRRCLQEALLDLEGELATPTSDQILIGGSIVSNDPNGRLPGYGPRDQGYIPVDGEDAKRLRDGSPGANEPVVEEPVVEEPVVEEPVEHSAVELVQHDDHSDIVVHDASSVEQADGDVIVHETEHHDDFTL